MRLVMYKYQKVENMKDAKCVVVQGNDQAYFKAVVEEVGEITV